MTRKEALEEEKVPEAGRIAHKGPRPSKGRKEKNEASNKQPKEPFDILSLAKFD